MDFEEDMSDSDFAEDAFSFASSDRSRAQARHAAPFRNAFEEEESDGAVRGLEELSDSEDAPPLAGAFEEDGDSEADRPVPAAQFRPLADLGAFEEDSENSGFALEEEEDADAWARPAPAAKRPLGRSSQFAETRRFAPARHLEESGESGLALEESADSDQALEESDQALEEESDQALEESAEAEDSQALEEEESDGESAKLEDRAEEYLLAANDSPAALEESDSEGDSAAEEPRSLEEEQEEEASEGDEGEDGAMDLEKAPEKASAPQLPASRDLEVEQYFHAGSDLELLRSKLKASSLSETTKAAYAKQLIQMEDILAQLSASRVGATEREELVGELKTRMGPVKAMTQEIDAATPKQPMDLEKEDGEPLLLALDSVKALKTQLGDHMSAKDAKNLNSLISDLQLFEGSTDAEESADLVRAIEMRLPAVQDLANHIRSVSVVSKAPSPVLDLEKDNAKDNASPAATAEPADAKAASKAPVPTPVNEMAAAVKTATTKQSALGLDKIHELQDILRSSDLEEEKRGRFMNNLEGLEKDEKALAATDLSAEQRSDLESAMKLRLAMLADMQQFLDKL